MPSTDRMLELKAKTLVAQTGSQPCVYAKRLMITDDDVGMNMKEMCFTERFDESCKY
jgi:hypothetical protein